MYIYLSAKWILYKQAYLVRSGEQIYWILKIKPMAERAIFREWKKPVRSPFFFYLPFFVEFDGRTVFSVAAIHQMNSYAYSNDTHKINKSNDIDDDDEGGGGRRERKMLEKRIFVSIVDVCVYSFTAYAKHIFVFVYAGVSKSHTLVIAKNIFFSLQQ